MVQLRSCRVNRPGQFTHRVAATTCCSETGLACLNPMNLRSHGVFCGSPSPQLGMATPGHICPIGWSHRSKSLKNGLRRLKNGCSNTQHNRSITIILLHCIVSYIIIYHHIFFIRQTESEDTVYCTDEFHKNLRLSSCVIHMLL